MLASLFVVACDAPFPDVPLPEPGAPPPPPPLCDLAADNALRVVCAVPRRDATGPIALHLASDDDGGDVVYPGDGADLDPILTGYDLLQGTAYAWSVVDRGVELASGEVRTGYVDPGLIPSTTVTIDGRSSIDRVLLPFGCDGVGALVILDGEGRIRWYQTFPLGSVTGFDYTDRDTIVAVLGRSRVIEWALDGTELLDLATGNGLERLVHHNVVGQGGRLLVLDTEPEVLSDGQSYLLDGVTEIVGGVGTHVWDVGAILDPVGLVEPSAVGYWEILFPTAIDFAHENAIEVTHDDTPGEWIVSLKHLHSVVRIDADGRVRWSLTGTPNPVVFDGPALTLSGVDGVDPTFFFQHHASLTDEGHLLLVDNGTGRDTDPTRVVELAIDEQALTATAIRDWSFGEACPTQGSAYPLPDGTILATCARYHDLFELDAEGIRRQVHLGCQNPLAAGGNFVRAQPVTLPITRGR
ncbi:MAG: aryl-sulfate sulfotransferase [Myxococcota bacterium]